MEDASLTRVSALLREADAVVIAASNGFDIADGYNQFACDQEFLRVFGDFHRAFGLTSILQGIAAQWPSRRARWAFLARLIAYGWQSYEPSSAMRALDALTREKPCFVITCNCNGRFERAGFDASALFETEGSFARLRCSAACSNECYDAAPYVERILEGAGEGTSDRRVSGGALGVAPGMSAQAEPQACGTFGAAGAIEVSEALIPHCSRCGAPLDIAVDDTGALAATSLFQRQQANFQAFLDTWGAKRILVLELGMGQRNLAIKRPLMTFAEGAPCASYAVINREPALLPRIPANRAASIAGDLGDALEALAARAGEGDASQAEGRAAHPSQSNAVRS